jgi:hypothetical protein
MPKDIEVEIIRPGKDCPIRGMTPDDLGMKPGDESVIPDEEMGGHTYLCSKGWRMCEFFAGYNYEHNTVECDAEGWSGYKKKSPGRG